MSFENVDDIVAIVDEIFDVEETCHPFGKRWLAQPVNVTAEQLAALQGGKYLAIDVNSEYVVFLALDKQGE